MGCSLLRTVHLIQATDDEGGLLYLEGYVEDVTDRKRAEEALKRYRDHLEREVDERTDQLRASEQRYRTIFDTAAAGIGRTRLEDGSVVLANRKLAEMFGYESVEQFIAEFVFSEHYVDPADRERLMTSYREAPGRPIECTFTRRDGSPISVRAHAIPDTEQGVLDFVATDETERKLAEERLRGSEERLRQATELARIGYYVWDAVEERCLFCSVRLRFTGC